MACSFRFEVFWTLMSSIVILLVFSTVAVVLMLVKQDLPVLSIERQCVYVRHSNDRSSALYDNCSDQYIPRNGIEGHLYLPAPVDACSYVSPPPGGFPTNSTWIALVYDYPACPTEMIINIRNAGYKLIIASSNNDSHRTVTREVSDTLFPIVIVEEYYADVLKRSALSFSIDGLVVVQGSLRLSNYLAHAAAFFVAGVVVSTFMILICCCGGHERCNCKWGIKRHLQKIKNLRKNFERHLCVQDMDDDQPHRSRFLQRKYMPFVCYNSAKNFKYTVLRGFANLKSHRMDQAAVLRQLSKLSNAAAAACSQNFRTSLLHYACLNGWNDIVKELVEKYSCDPNVKTHQSGVIFLLKLCASINICAMIPTVLSDDPDYHLYGIRNLAKMPQMQTGEQERELIQSFDVSDGAAIHCACKAGFLDIVKFLIEKGCNPKSRNVAGATPLHFACWEGHLDIVRFLVEKGCDPACTDDGLTPLHLACWKGYLDVVKFLTKEKICSANRPSNCWLTPLDYACQEGHLDIVKFLVKWGINPKRIYYSGYTPLHIVCAYGHLNIVKFLVVEQHCNHLRPSVNRYKPVTPLDLANLHNHIQVSNFLTAAKISRQAVYEYLSRCSFPPAFKVFVMGNHSVGKSTLVKAIQNRLITKWPRSVIDKFKKVSGVELNTAGIIPVTINSDKLGKIIMYDLAGQHEYYSGHAASLEKLVTYPGSLLIVVVDLSKCTEEIIQTLHYWISFIESHCRQSDSKPDIVTVGSHADVVEPRQSYAGVFRCSRVSATKEKSADILSSLSNNFQVHMPDEIISLDCTQLTSAGLAKVCDVIGNYCTLFQKTVDTDIRLNFLHALFHHVSQKEIACRVSEIVSFIHREEWDADTLSHYLPILSEKTEFLYLRNDQDVNDSWVILKQDVLLSEVNGTVFAPENFKQHHDISSSTGVVPFSNVKKTFPEYNPNMIISFMSHLEFCHQVAESEASLITKDQIRSNQQPSEKLYFFPALVSEDRPKESCKSIEQTHYKCGWSLCCIQPDQFLSPRFLRVLLLRLAFCFALAPEKVEDKACPVLQRRCNVWKNGIHWQNRDGVEAIVEVVQQSTAVTVMMGCLEGRELAFTRLRSEVIRTILEVKNRFCGAVELRESLIHPAELSSYPLNNPKLIPSFTITELATAIAEDKQVVTNKQGRNHAMLEISELLHFEPYMCFNSILLAEIFKDENSDKKVPGMLYTHSKIRKILSESSPTYKALRSALDRYSVFCGRDPLLLAGRTLQSLLASASPTSIATPQPTDNWQYLTMSMNSAGIVRALAANKLSERLAEELKARRMIGDTVLANATNHGPDVTEYTRVKHLITAILTSTESNQQCYYDFITVLQMDGICEDAEAALALLPIDPSAESPEAVTAPQHQQHIQQTEMHTYPHTASVGKSVHFAKATPTRKPCRQEIAIEMEDLSTIPDGSSIKLKPTRKSHDQQETTKDLSTIPNGTTLQPTDNWPYLTISRNSTGIIQALAANKLSESLAVELKARGMIGDTVFANATNHGPDVTEYTRVKYLITAILTSTESNQQCYYDFITVLQMDGICQDAKAALALLPMVICIPTYTYLEDPSAESPETVTAPQHQQQVQQTEMYTNPHTGKLAEKSHLGSSDPIPPNQSLVDNMFADSFTSLQSSLESLATSSPPTEKAEQVPAPAKMSSELPSPKAPKYWVQSLDLRPTDESQLLSGEWLTDKHITAANRLLSKQYPTRNGLQDSLILFEKLTWTSDTADFVQVINLSRQHWVCVSNIACPPGIVDVYDSLFPYSTKSVALQEQVAAIMKTQNRSFKLHFVDVQYQSGASDCALFAIAYAVSLCTGQDPHQSLYYQTQMRSHLHNCFITGALTLFPQSSGERRLARLHRIITRRTIHV